MNWIKRLLYRSEDPKDSLHHLNRRWRYWPGWGVYRGRVYLEWTCQLLQMDGRVYEEPWVVRDLQVQFVYDPRKWEISQGHMWYDGEHCSYQFGPFCFVQNGWYGCRKCVGE